MSEKDTHGFREVVLGLLVNEGAGIKVSVPHPEEAWVIRNSDDTASMGGSGNLYGFSSHEKAREYMFDDDPSGYFLRMYSWNDLVDSFCEFFLSVMIDPEREPGFYSVVPLKKDI